jgi:hypothetical protein
MIPNRNLGSLKITSSFLILSFAFFALVAANIAKAQQRDNFIVDKIYDYNNYLMAEYFYDNEYRLIKISVPEHLGNGYTSEWPASTDEFEYLNGRVSKIIHKDITYNMFNYETHVFYDLQGQLIRDETHINGLIYPTVYRYENGRVIGHTTDPVYTDTIVYDLSGNVTQHIYIVPELTLWGEPIWGTTMRVVYTYEYDDKLKPNFGLDYLFIYQPLPGIGSETGYARELSYNNLTKYGNSGTTWTYTYNENGLPETIEIKWYEIETLDPMLLRIVYKQIGEISISEVVQEIAKINIYPNPTKDKFLIDFEGFGTIILYDMLGNEALNQNINGRSEINISHLPKGIYYINVFSEGRVIGNSKIVKQ